MATTQGVMAQAPDPIRARIAPFTNQTSLLVVGGVTLIAVNFFTPVPKDHQLSVLDLAFQAGGLVLLLLIASVSEEGGSFALLFLAALWLGWFYTHRGWFASLAAATSGSKSSNSSSPTSASPTQVGAARPFSQSFLPLAGK